jgi:trehalose 6-phosphate synthase
MNLVAKEYIAAQDEADPGVLILSRFAGAALQLTSAVLVNPHSAEEVSEAIKRALHMPLGERCARHEALMDSVKNEDVLRWRADFVAALQGETLQDGTAQDALPA